MFLLNRCYWLMFVCENGNGNQIYGHHFYDGNSCIRSINLASIFLELFSLSHFTFKKITLNKTLYDQRHAKRNLRTYTKSVDPDQPQRLRRRVWSGSTLFDTRHISGTYISCCVDNWITCNCFQYPAGTDLCLHYL